MSGRESPLDIALRWMEEHRGNALNALNAKNQGSETYTPSGVTQKVQPPADRPIEDSTAAWLLTLNETRRRAWWR